MTALSPTHDLIAGYAAYTEAAALRADDAPAITPTTTTTSSGICGATISISITVTTD